jgi:acetyltransferase
LSPIDSPGYPVQWACVGTTRDQVTYAIRPIRADDAARERAFIIGLSPESRYTRMMYTMNEPSADLVYRFVHVDYHRSMAFVAVVGQGDDERIIGVARYATTPTEGVEFAISVADVWQGRGIADALTRLLFDYARIEGIRTLHAKILATNQRMIEFSRWLGMSIHAVPEDRMMVKASIDLSVTTPPRAR